MKDLRARVRAEQQAYKELESETVPRLKQAYVRKCKELEAITEKEGAVSQKVRTVPSRPHTRCNSVTGHRTFRL